MKKIAVITALVLASPASAQEKGKAACITRDACVMRGISHGWNSTQAGRWCERNKIHEGCYK